MPEINFGELRRVVQEEYAALGRPLSKRKADQIVQATINDGYFKQWLADIDQHDAERGLTDLDAHSDTTGRRAIMRALRAQYEYESSQQQELVAA